jgi:hypothetical protein
LYCSKNDEFFDFDEPALELPRTSLKRSVGISLLPPKAILKHCTGSLSGAAELTKQQQ